MKIYIDLNDWWIGYYRGANHHYVCPIPTLVIRWPRKRPLPPEPNVDEAEALKILQENAWDLYDCRVPTVSRETP
jgi:hypothetical protein